jgi:hypothetical protein
MRYEGTERKRKKHGARGRMMLCNDNRNGINE